MKKWIPLILWIIACGVSLYFLSSHTVPTTDWGKEYDLYLKDASSGWSPNDNMLNTCLVTTLFPALLLNILHTDPLLTYNFYLVFLISFLPVAAYYVYRQSTNWKKACLISLFITTNLIFLRGLFHTRTIIACTFFAIILWVMLQKRGKVWHYPILVGASLGIVFSAYSVAYINLLFFATIALVGLIIKVEYRRIVQASLVVIVLFIAGAAWYSYSLNRPYYYPGVVNQVITSPSDNPQGGIVAQPDDNARPVNDPKAMLTASITALLLTIGLIKILLTRHVLLSLAVMLGLYLTLIISWDYILLLLGLSVLIFKCENKLLIPLSVGAVIAMLLVIFLPYATSGYGIPRMYFQMLLPLGICFNHSSQSIGAKLNLNSTFILALIVMVNALWTLLAL